MVLFLALDGDGSISWIGRSSWQILGRPAEDLIARSALDLLHPDDVDVVLATLAETARNAEERILAVLRARHADGHWVTLEFGGIDLRDAAGNGTFLVWGRSYESASRLTAFLESLLAGQDLSLLLDQVINWCDRLAPYSNSVILGREADGTYRALAAADALPTRLGAGLDLGEVTSQEWLSRLAAANPCQIHIDELPRTLPAIAAEANLHTAWVSAVPGVDQALPAGLLVSWRRRSGQMLATHQRHLQEASRLTQLAFEWARSHQDLLAAATTDPLTGLANRSQLRGRVDEDASAPAALLFCDLDDFKSLNDQYGHAVGDLVLQAVADRLSASLRAEDLLVRLGGDEFAAWCPKLEDIGQPERLAGRLIAALALPIEVDGQLHQTSCSIGIALVDHHGGPSLDVDQLLVVADRALYQAKGAGKGRWSVLGV